MGRFEAARTLHFVTPKDFRVRHDRQFGRFAEETAREGAEAHVERACFAQAVLAPDFLEALTFALVVAKEMDGIILAQPAVELPRNKPVAGSAPVT